MNSSTIYRLTILALAWAAPTLAQTTTGRTDMFYDSGTNTIYAVSSFSPDYNTQYYYSVGMQTYLTKLGLVQSYGYWTSEWGAGGAVAATTAEPGYEYTAISYYEGTVLYQTYEVVYPCGYCDSWYDAYGYNSLVGSGGPVSDGPTFSVWVWAAPTIVMQIGAQIFQLGDSGAKRRAAGAGPVDFDVAFRNFIQPKWVTGPEPGCTVFDLRPMIYNGNGRGFTRNTIFEVKTHSAVILRPDTGSYAFQYKYTGLSKRYDKLTGLALDGQTLLDDGILHDCYKLDNQGFAPVSEFNIAVTGSPGTATAHFYGDAKNPVTPTWLPTPSITWDAYVIVSKATPQSPATFSINASHDCYPAAEVYIGEQRIHEFTPTSNDISHIAYCLGGLGTIFTSYSGQVY